MMHKAFLLFFLSFFVACTQSVEHKKSKTILLDTAAKKLIQKSIDYHDPQNNWAQLQSRVNVLTELKMDSLQAPLERSIQFDNKAGVFQLDWTAEKIPLKGLVNSDTCYTVSKQPINKEQEAKIAESLNCDRISMYKDYYHYLLGIPMKLLEEQAIITDSVLNRSYNGVEYDVVKINYEPLDKMPAWYFYFDKKDHSLELCKFTSAKDEAKGGEWIVYNGETTFNDIRFQKTHIWLFNTPERDTLAIEHYNFFPL